MAAVAGLVLLTFWHRRVEGAQSELPGPPGFRTDWSEGRVGRGIGNADEFEATRAFDLPSGKAGVAPQAQGLMAMATIEFEFRCIHGLSHNVRGSTAKSMGEICPYFFTPEFAHRVK